MTELYIIRHAWAEDLDMFRWATDWERPLTAAGRVRFRSVAGQLVERGFQPEMIATSPLVRCRETADIAAEVVAEAMAEGQVPVVELNAL
ncbi:MAG: histidine phosphatase family protein, partial [Patescibacteria group bacterium]|nr:histidine phosphatase family protein [Patescibacteria group bacterium]